MMQQIDHFIPAREESLGLPLERFLQPLPADVLRQYLTAYTSPGELIVDPMAQTPALLLTASSQGKRGIATNSNPINTLVVETVLTLPAPAEIDAATTQLGDSPKRGVPLRDHINQLYESSCHLCSSRVIVDHFLWDGEENGPVEKSYHCRSCGAQGQFPTDESDLASLRGIEDRGVHYWYLLERLAQPYEPERQLAEELLQLYTPRSLYALTDILMKMESLFADSPLQGALRLILLSCFDSCSKLAAGPLPRATALRIHPPSRFVEHNVWHAFEQAYRAVRSLAPASPITLCSEFEDVVEGEGTEALVLTESLRRLAAMLPPASVSLVVSAPQAYYRPFWTLSYLWSAWLLGRQEAGLLKPLLRRRTMGWSWYRRTLASALASLHRPLRPHGRMVFLLEEASLTHMANLILASIGAAFKLERVLYQPREAQPPRQPMLGVDGAYRISFTRDEAPRPEPQPAQPEDLAPALQRAAHSAIREVLRERGEALHFSWLHSAVYQRWARDGLLRRIVDLDEELSAADFLDQQLKTALDQALEDQTLELLPVTPGDVEGPQLWWLTDKGYPARPLPERVEHEVCDVLLEGAELTAGRLEDSLYSRFPGLFTPGPGLLETCLESYGLRDAASDRWRLRPEDDPERWAQERDEALALLSKVGRHLGYEVVGSTGRSLRGVDVAWEERKTPSCLFVVKHTTIFGHVLGASRKGRSEAEGYIVLPDRRLELLRFRLDTELLLRRALAAGKWQFIKLGNLRRLASRESMERRDLAYLAGLEAPIERPDSQLPLFS
jgi:hypothetical protein